MSQLAVVRSLLDVSDVSDATDSDQGADTGADSQHGDDTTALRVAAIFVILAAGLLGAIPPLFLKVFRNPDGTLTRVVRSFSAGVIIALALVHIVPEAVTEMIGLGGIEYPLGGTCVLFGVALMVFLEHVAHIMHDTHSAHAHSHDVHPRTHSTSSQKHLHSHADVTTPGSCQEDSSPCKPAPPASQPATQQHSAQCDPELADASHQHVCVSRGSASNWVTASAAEAEGSIRLKIVAYMFELGCIFHSFIIGLTLGVNKTDVAEVRALLIALSFHQFLEGVSLASVINRGGFTFAKGLIMIVAYSLTCPVGIAVGMAISAAYNEESTTARGVQGTFNGVSGGMLLYISLVQLVAEDMGRFTPGRESAAVRLMSFTGLFLGAASMCLLAVWA